MTLPPRVKLWCIDDDIDSFLLQHRETAEHVLIYIMLGPWGTPDDLLQYFVAIGTQMQKLKKVDIIFPGQPSFSFPIEAFSEFLRLRKKTLEGLAFNAYCDCDLTLRGTREGYDDFFRQLSFCTNLKRFAIRNPNNVLYSSGGRMDFLQWNHSLLGATQMETLQELVIFNKVLLWNHNTPDSPLVALCKNSGSHGLSLLSIDASREMFSSPLLLEAMLGETSRLEKLYCANYSTTFDDWTIVSRCLRSNRSLKELNVVSSGIPTPLLAALGENRVLETLQVKVQFADGLIHELDTSLIRDSMERMRSLKKLCFKFVCCASSRSASLAYEVNKETSVKSILQGLAHNTSLTSVHLPGYSFPRSGVIENDDRRREITRNEELLTALETNTTLTDVSFFPKKPSITAIFWLKYNGIGRRHLVDTPVLPNSQFWLDTLVQHEDDPSITFQILSDTVTFWSP